MDKNKGFTMVELVMFIVILGITANFISTIIVFIMRNIPQEHMQTKAIANSSKCLEYFLGQRYSNTFSSVIDNQTSTSFCNNFIPQGGFSTTINIENTTVKNYDGNQAFKLVTVETTGPSRSQLKLLIADY